MIETTRAARALYWRELAKRLRRMAREAAPQATDSMREAARIAREGADHYGAGAER